MRPVSAGKLAAKTARLAHSNNTREVKTRAPPLAVGEERYRAVILNAFKLLRRFRILLAVASVQSRSLRIPPLVCWNGRKSWPTKDPGRSLARCYNPEQPRYSRGVPP